MTQFLYGKDHLTAGIALSLSRGKVKGVLSSDVREQVRSSQAIVEKIVGKGEPVYGVNTGFGPLCTTRISEEEVQLLQLNILKSHSVGVGDPIPDEVAKLMLILKVHALAKGHSGVAETTLDRIIYHIDNNVVPIVPSQGSVGASGDLAPLSHLFLPLIGLGKVKYKGEEVETARFFKEEGLSPIELGPKEGLALINGTQFIAAFAVKVVEQLHNCLSHADIIGTMMLEGLMGSSKPFMNKLHALRPYKGNTHVAQRISAMLEESEIRNSHVDCDRVQDPYSIRCMPQVHGASRNAWLHLKESLETELNSVTDNPVIFSEDLTISGGNFHGQPLALPLDYACLAASEIGNISDRRIYLSLEGTSPGLPKLLVKETGINSGFMIPQYTSAALASENKGLCFPSSADSIPTSLGQEDHVSMGSIGSRKALQVVKNVEQILGIELLCAAQAYDFHLPLHSGKIISAIHSRVREEIKHVEEDKVFAEDINIATNLVRQGSLLNLADQISDQHKIPFKTHYHELFELY